MEEYNKCIKGKKGFSSFYQAIGKTKQMKVPSLVYDKIKYILVLLDKIGRIEGVDKVHTLLDGMITVLENKLKKLTGS